MNNNLPNNPTLGNVKEFINGVVNSVTTTDIDEQTETLILNKQVTISAQVEDN